MQKKDIVQAAKKKKQPSRKSSSFLQKKIKLNNSPVKHSARSAVKNNQDKYKDIVENFHEGYFEVDLKGKSTFFTDSLCRIHDCSREELSGKNYRQFTDKETTKDLFNAFHNIYKTGNAINLFSWSIIRKDGTKRYVEASVSLRKDSSGNPIGFRGVVRDVTDRREAEYQKEAAINALQKSEKYFKEITENSSDILIITDKNGNIKYCSRSIERFTGYRQEEISGKNAFLFIHPDDINRAADEYNKAILEKDTTLLSGSFRILHKNGSVIYLDGLGRNLLNNPDVAGYVMNVRDITERRITEEKLKEEEQRFKALAEQSSEVIVLINREGMITYVNPAIEKALGLKPDERIGLSAFNLIHPADTKIVNDAFKMIFNDPAAPVQKAEIRLRHKDRSWRTFEIAASNLVHDNAVKFAIVNLHDITDRKKYEHALQESRQKYRDLSIIDDLTQLYNSRHFHAQLKKEIQRSNRYGQNLTLLLLDLDKFKDFNDTYGHVEGDYVLSRLGKVIKRCLRESDSAYRYGGEEFTIMLPMTTNEEGIVIAKRIQKELKKESFAPAFGQNVYITVSIGLSQYKAKEEIKAFVHRVDQLMYEVKKIKRGNICFDDGFIH